MAHELVLISFDPGASIRDQELASSNARSHAARVCHSLRRNRSQNSPLTDRSILFAERKQKRVRKLASITLERDLDGSWKAEKISCSIDGGPEQTVARVISNTSHTSESTSNSRPRISRERLVHKSGLRKKHKGKLQRSRQQSARSVSSELPTSAHLYNYDSALKRQCALTRAGKRMEIMMPRDRAGFRFDPFSTYPVQFQRSIPEALDYCAYI